MIDKVIDDDGYLIDARCEIGSDEGKEGLILHSWTGLFQSIHYLLQIFTLKYSTIKSYL